jgi:3D (Asp-Asp-Asp) domain-containing protein
VSLVLHAAAAHHTAGRFGRHYEVNSTCYAQGGATATPGVNAYLGEVAVLPGFLPLGTLIHLDRPAFGRSYFRVRDHIGHGSELDIFNPSERTCLAYGRQRRGFRIVRH